MERIFEDSEGWEIAGSFKGSPNTSLYALKRYSREKMNSIMLDQIFAFKVTALTPPITTTHLISHKSIKYKEEHQIFT